MHSRPIASSRYLYLGLQLELDERSLTPTHHLARPTAMSTAKRPRSPSPPPQAASWSSRPSAAHSSLVIHDDDDSAQWNGSTSEIAQEVEHILRWNGQFEHRDATSEEDGRKRFVWPCGHARAETDSGARSDALSRIATLPPTGGTTLERSPAAHAENDGTLEREDSGSDDDESERQDLSEIEQQDLRRNRAKRKMEEMRQERMRGIALDAPIPPLPDVVRSLSRVALARTYKCYSRRKLSCC